MTLITNPGEDTVCMNARKIAMHLMQDNPEKYHHLYSIVPSGQLYDFIDAIQQGLNSSPSPRPTKDLTDALTKRFAELHDRRLEEAKNYAVEYALNNTPEDKEQFLLLWSQSNSYSNALNELINITLKFEQGEQL